MTREKIEATPSGRRRRVLVVDDNPASAETLAEVLEMLGHDVDVAFDGPGALAMARMNPPDVVICDIGLPGMSGCDVARALRATGSAALLFALSGYTHPDDIVAATNAGFDGYLTKPADLAQIERLLA
jgi:CheY-like chemotaxis protein